MRVIADNLEVRGCEVKVSATTNKKYAVVYVESSSGKGENIVCYDLELVKNLEKGTIVNFICILTFGKYTSLEITDFVVVPAVVPAFIDKKTA